MRIAIMGSGGVGGYLGGRLAACGEDVVFIARGAHLDAIREHGLSIESPLGDALVRPAQASDDSAAIGPVDLVIFAVKLYDTELAAEACRPLVGSNSAVVTFQNGVDSPQILGRILGSECVIGGVAQIRAVIAVPGRIEHLGITPRYLFGELDGRRSVRVEALASALERAGVDHVASADIGAEIWRKMVFLATLSGMTSLMRLPIGPIREDADTRAMLQGCIDEAFAVAKAKGAGLADDTPNRALEAVDALSASGGSSMLDDLMRGRRLELAWLSGTIARLGGELGLPTPTHASITTALKLHQNGQG